MAQLMKKWTRFLARSASPPQRPLTKGFKTLRLDQAIEEETLPQYDQEEFYPVHIGEVFHKKYQVLGKLGYGANSTVWFCRDLSGHKHVTPKVYVKTPTEQMNREILAYRHLQSLRSSHIGRTYVRELLDSFQVARTNGDQHHCLIHPPLHITLFDLQGLSGKLIALPEDFVRGALRYVLQALDFLQSEANITHCDIKLSNILLTINDTSVLDDFEETECNDPCPRKVINSERTIYMSRNFRWPKNRAWGDPVLCDFGEARIGGPHSYEEIQPEVYKAPEIIMQTDWSHPVDIWNTACIAWDTLEAEHLFDARDEEDFHNNGHHMAEMVSYLGMPPQEFLRRSEHTPRLFDEKGKWKGRPPLPALSLEDAEKQLEGRSKAAFLAFMRSMLTWLPENRKSPKALLLDPWLNGKV